MRDGGKSATDSATVRCGAAWRRVARAAMRSCSSFGAEAGGIAAPVSLGLRTHRHRKGPRQTRRVGHYAFRCRCITVSQRQRDARHHRAAFSTILARVSPWPVQPAEPHPVRGDCADHHHANPCRARCDAGCPRSAASRTAPRPITLPASSPASALLCRRGGDRHAGLKRQACWANQSVKNRFAAVRVGWLVRVATWWTVDPIVLP